MPLLMKNEEQIKIRLQELKERQNKSKSITINAVVDGQIDILEWTLQ